MTRKNCFGELKVILVLRSLPPESNNFVFLVLKILYRYDFYLFISSFRY